MRGEREQIKFTKTEYQNLLPKLEYNYAHNKTSRYNFITDGRHGVENHRQMERLLISLLRLLSKKTSKLRISDTLWGESTGHRWISLTTGQ